MVGTPQATALRLGLLTEWVTAELVDEVLADCGTWDRKPGALPARFMVYYVLALARRPAGEVPLPSLSNFCETRDV